MLLASISLPCEGFSPSSTGVVGTTFFRPSMSTLNMAKKKAPSGRKSSSGKGFGGKAPAPKGFKDQTYGSAITNSILNDIIDTEEAMTAFFTNNKEWDPVFYSLISNPNNFPAMDFLPSCDEFDYGDACKLFDIDNSPWRQLNPTPSDPDDLSVIAKFLDSTQQSLVDIPVYNTTIDDAADLHFIEEGRRMLMISRFHVLTQKNKNRMEQYNDLFMTCWSEMAELKRSKTKSNGSLILLPDADLTELQRFADMNLHRPLDWLGVTPSDFEVATFERGSPGIRIIHQVQDIPKVEKQKPISMSDN